MPRKPRDRKAEYAARNRRAQEAGYTSYYAQRLARADAKAQEAGAGSASEWERVKRANRRWSQRHALRSSATYEGGKGIAYDLAYRAAWVDHPPRYQGKCPPPAIKRWFTVFYPMYTADEWDARYPGC